MKTLLTVLGGFFLFILASAGLMLGLAAHNIAVLSSESQAYVETTLPRVLSDPTLDNFVRYMAPQDKLRVNAQGATQFFVNMKLKLGKFASCAAPQGNMNANYSFTGAANITADYAARCRFENAEATTHMALRKIGGDWTVVNVRVEFPNADDPHAKMSRPA